MESPMKSKESWIAALVAIVAGAGAALAVSLPAFILGAQIAFNWLPGHLPPLGELFTALPFLAVLASVLGLPEGFLGARSGSWRAWYAWAITPLVGAAIRGFPCVAVCLFSGTSPLDPLAFTTMFGVTIGGFFSGLASRAVAASLESLARQRSGGRRRPNGIAAPAHVEPAAMRAVRWAGLGLLVLGTVHVAYVAMSLVALLSLITGPGPAVPGLIVLVLWAIRAALGVVMIIGGTKMRNLKGYRYVLAAAIAAIVPISRLFCLALPIGLWSLIILRDARVRDAF